MSAKRKKSYTYTLMKKPIYEIFAAKPRNEYVDLTEYIRLIDDLHAVGQFFFHTGGALDHKKYRAARDRLKAAGWLQ